MLTEEAHHMFVGETGVGRTIQAHLRGDERKHGITDPYDIDKIRDLGVIDLPTIQKKLNLHYTCRWICSGRRSRPMPPMPSTAGIKGRYMEQRIDDDHKLTERHLCVWHRSRTARS